MKKVFSLLITLAMLISTVVVPMNVSADASVWDGTADTVWDGEGTQAKPYLITSAAELAGLAKTVYNADSTTAGAVEVGTKGVHELYTGKYFKLTTDIDLGGKEWLPIGRVGMRFDGNFEGDGHIVKNLKTTANYYGLGLFGGTGTNVSISNIGIEKANFTFNGGLVVADYPAEGKDESYFEITYLSDKNTDGVQETITNDRIFGVGALVGVFGGGSITGCYAKDITIKNTGSAARNAGGLLGGPYSAISSGLATTPMTMTNCYVNGATISGNCGRTGVVYGSSKMGSSGFDHGVALVSTNCYATNAAGDFSWGFADSDSNAYDKWNNCFTTKAFYTNTASQNRYKKDHDLVRTATEIAEYFTTVDGWSVDNEKAPINNGYPVLVWENTWESTWGGPTDVDTVWDGEGTPEKPYLITSAAELAGLASKVYGARVSDITAENPAVPVAASLKTGVYFAYTNKYFKLMTDINLAGNEWLPIGRFGMRFDGNFDGNNHVVKGIYITKQYTTVGLFGGTGRNARISDIGVEDVNIQVTVQSNTALDYDAEGDASQTVQARCRGLGSLVGASMPGGTAEKPMFENCYARNVTIKQPLGNNMNSYGMGGLIGQSYYVTRSADTTNPNNNLYIKNCYVEDVDLQGYTAVSSFIGSLFVNDGNSGRTRVNPCFTNCYSADVTLASCATDGNTEEVHDFFYANDNISADEGAFVTNCYTTATDWKDVVATTVAPTYGATVNDIAKALITGDNTWNLDRVENPTNGGYPVLGWEKWWTTESDPLSSFKGAGVTVADGFVTDATVVQNDSAVSGTVVVAVYGSGNRFKSAVTATAVNGVIDIDDMAVVTGDTVKVFVWNSLDGVSPLALVYSTTVQ